MIKVARTNVQIWPFSVCAVLTLTSAALAAKLPEAKDSQPATVESVNVVLPKDARPVLRNIAALFARQVQQRCGARVELDRAAALRVELSIKPGIGAEGFRITDGPPATIRIVGNDERGVLYGVGKFLHTSQYQRAGFTPGVWRGHSVPQKPIRGIYFATHFDNFYDAAPIAKVCEYAQELGLWGFNSLGIWYDMHDFAGFDDPKAVADRRRIGRILQSARDIGVGTTILVIANEGDQLTSPALREHSQHDDYGKRYICPNAPGGMDCLTKVMTAEFAWAEAFQPEYLILWPHDPGGCECAQCAPWGANGYLKCAQALALLGKKQLPGVKIILSTWWFNEKEWHGLEEKFRNKPDWCDVLMSDGRLIGGLPSVEFPEISMYGNDPWGGFGANIMIARLWTLWNQRKERVERGWPYSEGIYEDMNKICCSQLYWQDRPVAETIKEYAAFEFSPAVADDVATVVKILEKNTFSIDESARQAFVRVRQIDAKLPVRTRQSWRWRILYLRAQLGKEMLERNKGKRFQYEGARLDSEVFKQAFSELKKIYHGENAAACVKPPVIK